MCLPLSSFPASPSPPQVIDALLLGCIPVLFHPGQQWQWPWHWGAWAANATVLLDWRRVTRGGDAADSEDLVRTLRAIPDARVDAMRAVIAQHAHQLQWSTVDSAGLLAPVSEGDAFDVTLRAAWARAREDAAALIAGKLAQRETTPPPLMAGYCAVTDVGEGASCARDDSKGSWRVGGQAACLSACRECERCHYVSYSDADHDCSWFRACPALLRHRHGARDGARGKHEGEESTTSGAAPLNTGHSTWQVRHANGTLLASGDLGTCQHLTRRRSSRDGAGSRSHAAIHGLAGGR